MERIRWLQLGLYSPCDDGDDIRFIDEPQLDTPTTQRLFRYMIQGFNREVERDNGVTLSLGVFVRFDTSSRSSRHRRRNDSSAA